MLLFITMYNTSEYNKYNRRYGISIYIVKFDKRKKNGKISFQVDILINFD